MVILPPHPGGGIATTRDGVDFYEAEIDRLHYHGQIDNSEADKEGSDKPPTITRLLFVKCSRTTFACRRLFHGSCRDLFCVIHFDAPFLCGILKEILCGNGKFLSVNCQCVILKEIIEIEHIAIVIGNLNDLVIVIEEFVTDYCCILNR
ncbi:unknown [Ruminococcus sp. CAG:382]|nr:unknown [Ruminococcus sp. CAG:382]